MSLKGKIALITGAASGIGHHIAKAYLDNGAKVVIADRDLKAAQGAAEQLSSKDKDIIGLEMDVTQEEQVNQAIQDTAQHFGGLDVLISNAGIQHIEPIDQLSLNDWQKCMS